VHRGQQRFAGALQWLFDCPPVVGGTSSGGSKRAMDSNRCVKLVKRLNVSWS